MAYLGQKLSGRWVDPVDLIPPRYRPAGAAAIPAAADEPSEWEQAVGWAMLGRGLMHVTGDD